jgi:hypothetical protein
LLKKTTEEGLKLVLTDPTTPATATVTYKVIETFSRLVINTVPPPRWFGLVVSSPLGSMGGRVESGRGIHKVVFYIITIKNEHWFPYVRNFATIE